MATTTRAQDACLAWVSDPRHAWLAVSLDDEDGFPEAIKFASEYSYLDITGANFAGIIYLEEDADASKFIEAYGLGELLFDLPDRHTSELSFVRGLPKAK